MRLIVHAVLAAALVGVFAIAAPAQSAAPGAADVVKARQANYKALGGAFKTIADQLKSGSPDLAVIKPAAAKMKDLAAALPTWFPAGTGPDSGVKTSAKPEIWSDPAGFAAAAKSLADATATLDQLAQAGDLAGLQGQTKPVGMTCGACHSKFKVKDQH